MKAIFLSLALLFVLPVRANTDVVGVYLTWQADPATTMTVNWVNLYAHTPATSVKELLAEFWRLEKAAEKMLEGLAQ